MKWISTWIAVLRRQGKKPGAWMLRPLLTPWRWRVGGEYRRLMDMCRRCEVFSPELDQCGDGKKAGCGCHMPTKIRFGGGCWANETLGERDDIEIGWKSSPKSRSRLTVSVRNAR